MQVSTSIKVECVYRLLGFDHLDGTYSTDEFEDFYCDISGYDIVFDHDIYSTNKDGAVIATVLITVFKK